MKNLVISRRYAKALMLIGKEDGQAESYRDEIGRVIKLFDDNSELEHALTNPLFNKDDRKNVLEAVMQKIDFSQIMKSFLGLLFDKGRIGFLRDVARLYNDFADELKGIVHASLISATELSSESVEKIKDALTKKTGKNIILDVEQDPGLIGGVVTKIGDLMLDGSVKTQLFNMRETLKRGESV
ncbi:MAG: F0F1 ATP synthase subunit delta [Desulfobacteraceae bacterium]|nr:F0F1 ATP synthase subunit delta [Desulfobacteraceae bacterium]